jgi:hypothetical protein
MTPVRVDCRRAEAGWTCSITVGDDEAATHHVVSVTETDLDRLASGAGDPSALVEASFAFLLEREPRESIMRSFELAVISRYFPGYADEIVRRLGQ